MATDHLNEPDRDIDALLWDDVESSRSDASWGVDDLGWDELAPALPAEVAALLASPVAVTAEPLFFEDTEDEPDPAELQLERPRWSSREASATYAACAPRFLAPAPLRARTRRSGRRVRAS